MSKTLRNWLIAVGIIIIFSMWGIGNYNGLVQSNEQSQTAWSQVEAQYQRRFDLIPNLVNTVKGAFKQEQKIFSDIANARSRYAGATGKNQQEAVAAANELESSLARLLVIVENYPELKSMEVVKNFQIEQTGSENRISVARERFNESVQELNIRIKRFPTNIIAGLFNFEPRERFEAAEGSEKAPVVDLIQ